MARNRASTFQQVVIHLSTLRPLLSALVTYSDFFQDASLKVRKKNSLDFQIIIPIEELKCFKNFWAPKAIAYSSEILKIAKNLENCIINLQHKNYSNSPKIYPQKVICMITGHLFGCSFHSFGTLRFSAECDINEILTWKKWWRKCYKNIQYGWVKTEEGAKEETLAPIKRSDLFTSPVA